MCLPCQDGHGINRFKNESTNSYMWICQPMHLNPCTNPNWMCHTNSVHIALSHFLCSTLQFLNLLIHLFLLCPQLWIKYQGSLSLIGKKENYEFKSSCVGGWQLHPIKTLLAMETKPVTLAWWNCGTILYIRMCCFANTSNFELLMCFHSLVSKVLFM